MNSYEDLMRSLTGLDQAVVHACDWLTDISQVQTEQLTIEENRLGHCHRNWRGAFRGEYSLAERKWWFFCPTWHTGQAVKALVSAWKLNNNPQYLDSARAGAGFILNNQVNDGPDAGLILAYENWADRVAVSAVLETVDGLFALADATGEDRFVDAAIAALTWCRDRAWVKGAGLIRDIYQPEKGGFVDTQGAPAVANQPARPLADDAAWLTGFRKTDDSTFRQVFYEVLEQLLASERPPGNWVDYAPCETEPGRIHPRHAYWWGRPMLAAWRQTGEERWLDAACRAGQWYRRAQRADGGLFRNTYLDFNTDSFGHATSGVMCAAILWTELYDATQDPAWLEPIRKAMEFARSMQFLSPKDPNVRGAILERVMAPNQSDRNPYHIRDLGTIFFVQAATTLLLRDRQISSKVINCSPAYKSTQQSQRPSTGPSSRQSH